LDGVNLGAEDTTAPYSITWNTAQASNGSHTLTAVARDAAGNSTTSSGVSVSVNNGGNGDTTPPTVSITAPLPAEGTLSGSVTVSANASDNVGVVGVQFKLDGANLGAEDTTAPYSVAWNTAQTSNGSHTLTAVARDAAGNSTTSSGVAVSVNNGGNGDTTPPSVSITAPSATEGTISGSVAVSANASDNVGVVGVQFKVDGNNLGAEDTTSPYTITWNTTQTPNGSHSLTAVARDAAGNKTTSSPVSVTIDNSDKTAPSISIATPTPGATVKGKSVAVSANATDNVGVVGVQFKLDGKNLKAEDTTAPYSIAWDTTLTSNGSHTVTAVARDAAGNQISAGITVTVNNSTASQRNPLNGHSASYKLSDLELMAWETTDASAPMAVGYARIQPDSETSAIGGVAIFSNVSDGVLVSQAGVPISPLVESGRIYVDFSSAANTGIAIANPDDDDAVISFYFTDALGRNFGNGSFTLGAKRQISTFLNQEPFNLKNNMEGSFTFESSRSVSVVALRGLTNERGDFLMTTLPVAAIGSAEAKNVTVLPQFAIGGGWMTKLVLVNPTNGVLTGKAELFTPGAPDVKVAPLVASGNGIAGSSFGYSIPPRSIWRLKLNSVDGKLRAGSIRVTQTNNTPPASGLAVFSLTTEGVTVSEASVPIEKQASEFRVYAESYGVIGEPGSIQTGIAIANPATSAAVVQLELTDTDGSTTVSSKPIQIAAGGQVARMLAEVFPERSDFEGILRVTSTKPIAVIGLRLTANERGDYLMTTTPAESETTEAAPAELLFPHIVLGGGLSTEVVIFNRDPGRAASGKVTFSKKDGSPLEQ
jgi:hypothetical protein